MKIFCLLFTILIQTALSAQTILGNLEDHGFQEITIEGFDYYNTVTLAETEADSLGNFSLQYPKDYKGLALLKSQDNNSLVVLLSGENIQLQGTHIREIDSLVLTESENKTFFDYALAHSSRRNALNAWKHLDRLYDKNTSFSKQKKIKKAIVQEMQRLNKQEHLQINGMPKESYLRWFIPYRTFLQEMQTIIRTETERIPESITLFRTTDFNHPNWKTSGILQEFIEKHYFMLENSSGTVEEKQEKMNKSSLHLIDNLQSNEELFNAMVDKLFAFLEDRSLFIASEFLATQVLNDSKCEVEEKTSHKLEKYRNLKVGAKAPDIQLSQTQKLSDLKQPVLLVFGKSDCSYCKEEALDLLKYYHKWKTEKNVATVYVSIDTDEEAYAEAYENAPWQMFCDFKGWESEAVKDYHIWGTPTYFLLDKDLTILSHINSAKHANAWIMNRIDQIE